MFSIWEKHSFLHADYIVIGAGITGLSTAVSLKEMIPGSQVLVLDSSHFSGGASTRNAGFACFGSPSEILDDYQNFGRDAAVKLIENRLRGLEILKERLGIRNLDYHRDGGYELVFEKEDPVLAHLDQLNTDLKFLFKATPFFERRDTISQFGFREVESLLFCPFEGQLDAGKMMRALYAKTVSSGAVVLTGAKVETFQDCGSHVEVQTAENSYSSSKLIICTNALAADLVPGTGINPGRGTIICTSPVKNLPFKGSFHFDKGFYYFRNFRNQVIFGGGRNIDFVSEETADLGINEKILNNLKNKLSEIILPRREFTIEMAWTGIMGFGKNKHPVVKMVSDNVAIAAGLGGMGVALGSFIGQKVASLITGK